MINARQYNEAVKLLRYSVTVDAYGHRSTSNPRVVAVVPAKVRRMSASRQSLTFQMADIVGVDIEMRATAFAYDAIEWRGHVLTINAPEDVDDRGRIVRVSGYYQQDEP